MPKAILVLMCICCIAGRAVQQRSFDLAHPTRTYVLPNELMEVSALTDVDENTIACLQDEDATLYFYDLQQGRVIRRVAFGTPGDMEGLTRVGADYYALRSDGLIYRMTIAGEAMAVHDTFRLELPNHNIEGLGYDEARKRILIAPKDFEKGDKSVRNVRKIHALDPTTRRAAEAPALTLIVDTVIERARKAGFAVPMRTTPKGRSVPALKLRFSSVAVDPISDHYYLLSAADHILLVVDRQGKLVSLHQLDPRLFPKPEGITFLSSGALLISNEGKDVAPSLLRFERLH